MIVPSAKKIKDIFGDEIPTLRTMSVMDMRGKRHGPLLIPFTMLGTATAGAATAVGAGSLVAGMSATTLGLMTAGVGMSVASSIMQGNQAKQQAESQADMMERSASIEKTAALADRARGRFEAGRAVKAGERQASSMVAAMGEGGVKITGEGAPVAALGEQQLETDLEAEMIGYNAAIASGQHESQAGLDLMQAKILKQKGKNEQLAGWMGAGTSLLTGLGQMGMFSGGRTASSAPRLTGTDPSGKVVTSGIFPNSQGMDGWRIRGRNPNPYGTGGNISW